jgi:hypothetical protein
MGRIRSVHPAITEDEALAGVSAYAERTFVRLWTVLDDDGRAKDNALLLVAQLYPLDQKMTAERVERDLCELAQATLLERYEVDGKRYLRAKPEAWSRYQKPRRKVASKLPPPHPPDNVRTESDNRRTPPAGVGDGVGDGVTPNNRSPRELAPDELPQPVDKHLRLVERANGIAAGGGS